MKINHRKTLRSVAMAACLILGSAACGSVVHTTRRPITVRAEAPEAEPAPALAKIEISGKIRFSPGSATLMSESETVLEEVVTAMQENPGIQRVEIQGHTDSKGRARKNRRLSRKRANAVLEFLVDKGINEDRLTARGFGPDKPIADNDTSDGREENRRVEFVILEQTPTSVALGDSQ